MKEDDGWIGEDVRVWSSTDVRVGIEAFFKRSIKNTIGRIKTFFSFLGLHGCLSRDNPKRKKEGEKR